MFVSAPCQDTVTILEALLFGTDGACLDLSMPSIYWSAAAFAVAVVVLKVLGRFIISLFTRGIRSALRSDEQQTLASDRTEPPHRVTTTAAPSTGRIGKTDYDGGPIKSLRTR